MLRQKPAHNHIAELDGLRALAVLPVIAFHFGANVNGSAGVTVFFALSGFIVTTVLLREHDQSGSIRLGDFYTRRFRRLLPASTLVVIATVITGWILSKPPIVRESLAALTYWADIERFTSTYSYGQSGYAPLEHFWSLAIEEQFYVVLPVACLLLLRFGRTKFALVIGAAAAVSVWFALAGSADPLMYFHPLARVCELLVGVLLALSAARLHRYWGIAALAMLAVILSGAVRPLPVITAAVTCLVIAGLPRVLAWAPLVLIGQYSYGLYLWHPLAAVIATTWQTRVLLAVVLAAACLHFVEAPVRFAMSVPRARRVMVAMSVAGLVVIALPFGRLAPTFIPAAPVVQAAPADPVSGSGEKPEAVPVVKRPLRISGAGDSTQMFMDAAWQAYAAANPDDLTWVLPDPEIAVWTSGADSWIRDVAPTVPLSLAYDGPQGGLDRQGCPLVYDLEIRAVDTMRFTPSDKLHSPTPLPTCDWHIWMPPALARMHLDVLVVSWGVTAMWEYLMPDKTISYIGEPEFDAVMLEHMRDFEAMAASYGTSVVWATYAPKMPDVDPARWTFPQTIDALAAMLLDRKCSADLRPLVRSEPNYPWYQDGYHFTAQGAARAVAWIAPSIEQCGLLRAADEPQHVNSQRGR